MRYNFAIAITLAHLFYMLFFSFVNFIINPKDKLIGLISTLFGILILFITTLLFFVIIKLIKICSSVRIKAISNHLSNNSTESPLK